MRKPGQTADSSPTVASTYRERFQILTGEKIVEVLVTEHRCVQFLEVWQIAEELSRTPTASEGLLSQQAAVGHR